MTQQYLYDVKWHNNTSIFTFWSSVLTPTSFVNIHGSYDVTEYLRDIKLMVIKTQLVGKDRSP